MQFCCLWFHYLCMYLWPHLRSFVFILHWYEGSNTYGVVAIFAVPHLSFSSLFSDLTNWVAPSMNLLERASLPSRTRVKNVPSWITICLSLLPQRLWPSHQAGQPAESHKTQKSSTQDDDQYLPSWKNENNYALTAFFITWWCRCRRMAKRGGGLYNVVMHGSSLSSSPLSLLLIYCSVWKRNLKGAIICLVYRVELIILYFS